MDPTSAPENVQTVQNIQATEVKEYRHDFPALPPDGSMPPGGETKRFELKFLTGGVGTDIEIWCDRPFRLWFAHPHQKRGDTEPWPRDPLPMGVPIRFKDIGWTEFIVRPYLFPAKLRVWVQRNQEVE